MRNLDLNNYGVQEMSAEEAMKIEGGSWFSRNWKAVVGFCGAVYAMIAIASDNVK